LHVAVKPGAVGQTWPQVPQLFLSEPIVFTQAAFTMSALQSVVPGDMLHDSTQVEPLHASVPPPEGVGGHMTQAPGALPQSIVPAGQELQPVGPQRSPDAHVIPQLWQLLVSVEKFTHVRLAPLPQEFGNEGLLHVAPHIVPVQAVPPLGGGAGHMTHALLQTVVPAGQAPHIPLLQLAPVGHTLPQVPQLFGSVSLLTSQPSDALTLQSRKPAVHTGIAHAELMQTSVAWFMLQALPQPWQLLASFDVSVSQPSAGFPLQSANGGVHDITVQVVPIAQTSTPCDWLHAAPHIPQLLAVVVAVSQPSLAIVLQSANPALHD
jgi:hypothetical protein